MVMFPNLVSIGDSRGTKCSQAAVKETVYYPRVCVCVCVHFQRGESTGSQLEAKGCSPPLQRSSLLFSLRKQVDFNIKYSTVN